MKKICLGTLLAGRKTYDFSIEDLDSVLSKEYDGCAELSSAL